MPVTHLQNGKYRWGKTGAEYDTREEAERQGRAIEAAKAAREDVATTIPAPAAGARVDRFDAGRLGKLQRTPTGGVRVPATTSRTGIQEYRRTDGTIRREYRPLEEVQAHLDTLAGAAVTIGHPRVSVTAESWQDLAVGVVSDRAARLDAVEGSPDQWAHTDLLLQRADVISRVERGELGELSEGYSCRLDETPGALPNGERYDAVQREIKTNHVALLPAGCARAGSHARLRLDGSQEPIDPPSGEETSPMADQMIKIDGVDFVVGSPSHISALTAAVARRDEQLTAATAAHTAATAKLTADRDTQKERADRAEAALATYREKEKTDSLATLVKRVQPVLGATYDGKGKTAEQVRRDALTKLCPTLSLEGKTDAWIEPYLEARLESVRTDFRPTEEDRLAAAQHRDEKDKDKNAPTMRSIAAQARQDSFKQFA